MDSKDFSDLKTKVRVHSRISKGHRILDYQTLMMDSKDFSDLKTKMRVHSGISKVHRKKLLEEYIERHY